MKTFRIRHLHCISFLHVGWILLLVYSHNGATAQRVYHLDVNNGLCNNSLTDLTLDRYGNMWIGSYSGLMKYTGTNIKCFTKIGKGIDAISGPEMHSVTEDPCGFIWIGTTAGVDKINPVTYEVVHYPIRSPFEGSTFVGYIYAVYADSYNFIWLCTDVALFRLDTYTGDYVAIPVGKDGNSISHYSTSYNGFVETKEGLWILTAEAMALYDYRSQQFYHRFHNPENKNIFKTPKKSPNAHADMDIDDNGKLWFVLEHSQLASYDIAKDQLDTFNFTKKPGTWNCCYALAVDDRQNIWIGTRHGGVILFDTQTETFTSLQDDGINRLIRSDYIYGIERGPDGRMFVSHDNGLDIIDLYDLSLRELKISEQKDFLNLKYQGGDITFNHDQTKIYIPFYDSGFFIFDIESEVTDFYKTTDVDPHSTPYVIDLDGKKYMAVDGNLQEIRIEENQLAYTGQKLLPDTISKARGHIVWLYKESPTSYYMKKSSGNVLHVNGDSLETLRSTGFEPSITLSPDRQYITYLTPRLNLIRRHLPSEKDDTIGLQEMLKETDFSFANSRQITDDGTSIWMTGQNGILRYDLGTDHIASYDVTNGLSHNFTFSIVLDPKSNVWVGSIGGIDRYDKKTDRFVSVHKIYDNTYMDAFGNAICSDSGELFFQCGNKLIRIRSDSTIQGHFQPIIQLNEIRVNGKNIDWRNEIHLENLRYHENRLTFIYDMLHYDDIQLVSFQYRLNGREWIDNGQRNEVNLDGLGPDDYIVELRGSVGSVTNTTPSIEIPFSISPPWWKQWWFLSLLFLSMVAVLLVYFRNRIDKYRKELIVARQISDLEAKALRAQMNPHFVFNSLNAIQECIVTGRVEEAYTYLSKFSRLLRMVLEHSDLAEISLQEELEVLDLYISLEKLRFKNDMEYSFQLSGDIDPEEISLAPMLIQPHLENAIWHGLRHKEGLKKLSLSIGEEPAGYLKVMIEDNGVGRKRSAEIRQNSLGGSHKSKGRQLSENRMDILKKTYPMTSMTITDLYHDGNPSGTLVVLVVPMLVKIPGNKDKLIA